MRRIDLETNPPDKVVIYCDRLTYYPCTCWLYGPCSWLRKVIGFFLGLVAWLSSKENIYNMETNQFPPADVRLILRQCADRKLLHIQGHTVLVQVLRAKDEQAETKST